MDPLDRFGQQISDREGFQLGALLLFLLGRHAVGGDHPGQGRAVDPLDRRAGEDGMRARRGDGARSFAQERFDTVNERAGRVDDVIDDEFPDLGGENSTDDLSAEIVRLLRESAGR